MQNIKRSIVMNTTQESSQFSVKHFLSFYSVTAPTRVNQDHTNIPFSE